MNARVIVTETFAFFGVFGAIALEFVKVL